MFKNSLTLTLKSTPTSTVTFFWCQMKGMDKIRLYYSSAMELILPQLKDNVGFVFYDCKKKKMILPLCSLNSLLICLSFCPLVHLSVCLSFCLLILLSVDPSVCLSFCLFFFLSFYLTVLLTVCLSLTLFRYGCSDLEQKPCLK